MTSRRAAFVASLLALSVAGVPALAQAPVKKNVLTTSGFKVPSPKNSTHPGADAAPASSPATYQLEAGFQARADVLVAGLATRDLSNWRKGYFQGGDPGKYTHGPIMAKLLLDSKAADAIAMQNDDRSPKEQYHFACVNWSRFLPIFSETLTDKTKDTLAATVGKYGYLGQGGTENHKTMWITSANVLPHYTTTGRLQHMGKDQALARAKADLKTYVKGIYAAGQGEWDSSTYLMFDVNGMLNIYDFSPDEEARIIAKAALDWYMTGYALKYTDGVYCSPNQRGFAEGAGKKITDNTGWLWWGSNKELTPADTAGFNWAMHAALSSWRPNKVITNIATRNLPTLPFESKNSKPNYWGTSGEPKPNQFQETVFVSKHYTMGSLWRGFGGQMTRFQIVASSPTGGLSFNGATPFGRNDGSGGPQFGQWGDGNGMFDQSTQVGRAYVMASHIDADKVAAMKGAPADAAEKVKELAFAFFAYPAESKPVEAGEWFVFQAGNTYVAVRGIAGKGEATATPPDRRGNSQAIIKFPGYKTGFVVETSDVGAHKTLADFTAALAKTKLQATMTGDPQVTYTSVEGKTIELKYQAQEGRAAVTVDGKAVDFADWPVYENPYIQHKAGVMTVNDGTDGFTVDFTGDLPVYKAWKK